MAYLRGLYMGICQQLILGRRRLDKHIGNDALGHRYGRLAVLDARLELGEPHLDKHAVMVNVNRRRRVIPVLLDSPVHPFYDRDTVTDVLGEKSKPIADPISVEQAGFSIQELFDLPLCLNR
jgi:hypothetical protein